MKMTADDWQLYTASMKCGAVARHLTKELNRLLKETKRVTRYLPEMRLEAAIGIRDAMYRVMDNYSDYGARDTEPEWALVHAINKELKTDIGRL